MGNTKNLGLTTFGTDEYTSWLGYNQSMEKIDEFAGKVTTSYMSGTADVKNLQERTAKNEEDIAKNTAAIGITSTSISAAQIELKNLDTRENEHYTQLTQKIENLNNEASDQSDSIKVLQANVKTIRDMTALNTTSISKMKNDMQALDNRELSHYNELSSEQSAQKEEIEKISTDTAALDSKVDIIENKVETASTQAQNAVDTVAELEKSVATNTTSISSMKIEIKNMKDAAENTTSIIKGILKINSQQTQDIENNKSEIDSLDKRVESLEDKGSADALTQRVDALETFQQNATQDITAAQTTATAAQTTANNVQQQVVNIKSGAAVPFSFGVDAEGNYGYMKEGADTVTPFLKPMSYTEESDIIYKSIQTCQVRSGQGYIYVCVSSDKKMNFIYTHEDDPLYYKATTSIYKGNDPMLSPSINKTLLQIYNLFVKDADFDVYIFYSILNNLNDFGVGFSISDNTVKSNFLMSFILSPSGDIVLY